MKLDAHKAIAKHLYEYSRLIQAEAEKVELLGIHDPTSLFNRAMEIFELSQMILKPEKPAETAEPVE
ncbi:MAG TPA: hypothetical protein VK954_07920 [Methyloradius sp.]|jgi:hypothetical protein|nr:hypothetical protein [Methyloradius sp.]